jgi:RNA methyltransferase, TrmH family
VIESSDNPKIKHIQKLLSKSKFRKETRHYIVESIHHLKDILDSNPEDIQYMLYTTMPQEIQIKILETNIPTLEISEPLLKKCTDVKQSSGCVAVVHYPIQTETVLTSSAFYLDQISNPKNLGAIIRNSAAFGLNTLYISPKSVDPFHPEAIRASAGTLSKIRIIQSTLENILNKNPSLNPIILDSNSKNDLKNSKLKSPSLIILGSEKGFLDSNIEKDTVKSYKISLENNVDSLNLAVTSGILGFYLTTV